MKLFISYRSLDSSKVDVLVTHLRSLKNDAGQPRFDVWQDKTGIPPGRDWWQAIVDAITACDVFVLMVSQESAQNVNCRAELSYAHKRNRHILPLVLEGEYTYNPVTGKNDVAYWQSIPAQLDDLRAQFLFYEGTSFLNQLDVAIADFARHPRRDMPAERPHDPRNASDATASTPVLYDEACDAAWRLDLATAERNFQKLVNLNDPIFAEDAHDWILILREYQTLLNLDARESTRYKVTSLWTKYAAQFPRLFTPLFDPHNFQARYSPAQAVAPAVPAPGQDLVQRGLDALNKGSYNDAIQDFEAAQQQNAELSLNDDLAGAYFKRGYASRLKGDHAAAITDFTEALRLKPGAVEIIYRRASSRLSTGDIKGALADFDEVIRLHPDDAEAYVNRGVARRNSGDIRGALADYDRAIQLNPDNPQAYLNRGVSRRNVGNIAGALADYDRAIQLNPDNPIAFFNRANLHAAQGNLDLSLSDYSDAIRLKPDYLEAYNNRGALLANNEDNEAAISDFSAAIRLRPDYASAYSNRGELLSNQERYDEAIADFTEAIRLKPDNASGYNSRAWTHYLAGNFQEAIDDATTAISLQPAKEFYDTRGMACIEMGDYVQAIADFEAILRIDPNDADAKQHLAEARRKSRGNNHNGH